MQLDIEQALIVNQSACPFPVVRRGQISGSEDIDSLGQVCVFGAEGNYLAGYATETGRYVIECSTSYFLLSQAIEGADTYTRNACGDKDL